MEEKSQPTAAPSDAPPLSGSFEGLHEAAQELKLQRDEDDAPIEVVEVPNLEDKVSIRDGAKKLTDWRQERDAERAAFDRAVFGDSPVAEDSAVETITAPADAPELLERMYDEFILARASAKKPSTQKLYTGAFKHFHEWCADAGASALPARIGTVAQATFTKR